MARPLINRYAVAALAIQLAGCATPTTEELARQRYETHASECRERATLKQQVINVNVVTKVPIGFNQELYLYCMHTHGYNAPTVIQASPTPSSPTSKP